MKKIIFSIFLCFILIGAFGARSVYAHTLKIDRSIGVSVHINPDDSPTVGKESAILVEITDNSGRFNAANPSNCLCTLTISTQGVAPVHLPIVSGGSYAQLRYTFPASGKYMITVEGKPNGEGKLFQSFSLTYEYFVQGDTAQNAENPLVAYVPYVQALCGAMIVWMFVSVRRR